MGRGKRVGRALARLGAVGREIALSDSSDSGRDLRVPAQLTGAFAVEAEAGQAGGRGRWKVMDQTVQAYPEGSKRYIGFAVATKSWAADALNRDRPRVLHGRAVLEGEVAVIKDSSGNEVARAEVIDQHGHQAQVTNRQGRCIGELFMQDAKVSATVFDSGVLRGVVKVQGARGQRGQLDIRLGAVAAYFFFLES